MSDYDHWQAIRQRESRRTRRRRYGFWCAVIVLWTVAALAILADRA